MPDLFQWFTERFQKPAVQSVREAIPQARVVLPAGVPAEETPLVAGEHYFQVWLADLFLADGRKWFQEREPAVYSVVRLSYGDKSEQISHVVGPSRLQEFAVGGAPRVATNYPLTDVLPFNGSLELEAGLVSTVVGDDVKAFLSVLNQFSKLLVVPQLSAALAVAAPLAEGVRQFVGATNAKPHLRTHDSWTDHPAAPLRAGYLALVGADAKEFKKGELCVRDNRLHCGPDVATAPLLTGFDYMLFRVDCRDRRADYEPLTSIQQPFSEAINYLEKSIIAPSTEHEVLLRQATHHLAQAKVAAFRSKDLTRVDAQNRVIKGLQDRFDALRKALGSGAAREPASDSLNRVMENAPSASTAALEGVFTEEDLRLS